MRISQLAKIKVLVLDVDGVLTDNKVYIFSDGKETKGFNIADGYGIYLAQKNGIKVALVSGRFSESTNFRAKELEIEYIFQGVEEKNSSYEKIKQMLDVKDAEICYIGDDLPDIPILEKCGFSVCVKNGQERVKRVADYVTESGGGDGAVREVINLILKAKKIKV